ncbi:hypothetical protein NEOLEDRAFT_500245 [Neolentinus lepideus HHB14362 ss-1]|uniref:Uncharacterized protein n=1 Tax=Neolentinus lepideus HHB14362 ss-1 TaxID=1314782 RepID=A0A165RPU1_9AGAM|nr:hypothetical protein NEOLEDRAFT_500245 [Neolentinus lepideus HHB14362 ss-1]
MIHQRYDINLCLRKGRDDNIRGDFWICASRAERRIGQPCSAFAFGRVNCHVTHFHDEALPLESSRLSCKRKPGQYFFDRDMNLSGCLAGCMLFDKLPRCAFDFVVCVTSDAQVTEGLATISAHHCSALNLILPDFIPENWREIPPCNVFKLPQSNLRIPFAL